MKARMNIGKVEPLIYKSMAIADREVESFNLEPKLKELVKIRTSQINGCGYCINYHSKDARKLGETEQRIYALSAWWETPFFSEEEQAALKLTEQVTNISKDGVEDEVFSKALKVFGELGIAQLIFIIVNTNSWNRLAISTHLVAEDD